jgi:transposase-like protein
VLFKRNRTSSKYIYYALHLYFSGLSLRKASEHLFPFIKRNHVSVWNWIQRFKPKKILQNKRKVSEFIIDETLLKVGNQYRYGKGLPLNQQTSLFLVLKFLLREAYLLQNGLCKN